MRKLGGGIFGNWTVVIIRKLGNGIRKLGVVFGNLGVVYSATGCCIRKLI